MSDATKKRKARQPISKFKHSQFATTGQVSKWCDVAPRTVSKWCDSGMLECIRNEALPDRRIPLTAVVEFMKKNRFDIPAELAAKVGLMSRILFAGLDFTIEDTKVSQCKDVFELGQCLTTGIMTRVSYFFVGPKFGHDVWIDSIKRMNLGNPYCRIVAYVPPYHTQPPDLEVSKLLFRTVYNQSETLNLLKEIYDEIVSVHCVGRSDSANELGSIPTTSGTSTECESLHNRPVGGEGIVEGGTSEHGNS